ncbi:MAG: 30S ribosomal protein S17 [Verrucomicrobia bacterium]|nr:30S ribosomal protein S17 [Verrucomicrobiota bacterium]
MSDTATVTPDHVKATVRKTRVGKVVSDKMNKTIVVEVERRVPHPQFKKIIRHTSKFYAHDEQELGHQSRWQITPEPAWPL